MSDERKTVAGAYAKIESHEELCAERYRRLDEQISDVKDGMNWALRLLIGCLIADCAFFLQQQMGA